MSVEHVRDEEIAHLDFDPGEKHTHWAHPTDPTIFWCGKSKSKPVPPGVASGRDENSGTDPSAVTCVPCLHLYIEKGGPWWWRVNRAWYGGQSA